MEIQKIEVEVYENEFLMMYVDTFSETFENIVDSTLDKAIEIQRDRYRKYYIDFNELTNVTPKSEEEDNDIEMSKFYKKQDEIEILNIAFSLYELKIIYACKYFEIKLMELYSKAFNELSDTEEAYKWEQMKAIYKKKNIVLSEIGTYENIIQLREVNNNLKHKGGVVTKRIRNIPEFKGINYLLVGHLKEFYERVKDVPKAFIEELSGMVYKERFRDEKPIIIEYEFEVPDEGLPF